MVGTIVVAVLLGDDSLSVTHLDDSQLYRVRENIQQLTTDRSVVMEQVRRGLPTSEEAGCSHMQNMITRALARCVGHRRAGAGNSFRTFRRSAAVSRWIQSLCS